MPEDVEPVPGALETRLHRALGPARGSSGAGDPAPARTSVLARIRQRRRLRLQVATGGLVAVLGLAVTLPLAIRGGNPSPSSEGAVASPAVGPRRAPASQTTSATCRAGANGTPMPCGVVGPAVFGTATNAGNPLRATHPIDLRIGEEATVELPVASTRVPWQPIDVASGGTASSSPVVAVHHTARRDVWTILAEHQGETVVQSTRRGCAGTAPCLAPTTIWTLHVEVTS